MQLPIDTTTAQGRILAAAAAIFSERGIAEPTVEDILSRAEISRRTFYKHFSSKEDVVVTLHRALSDRFLAMTRMAAEEARSPEERIERTVDLFLLAAVRGGALFRVVQTEAMRQDSRLAPRRREVFAALVEIHRDTVAKSGKPPPDPLYVHGVVAGVEAMLHRLAADGPLDEERLARARVEMLRLMKRALYPDLAGA
jgi:AcrR family transcriptional regulator